MFCLLQVHTKMTQFVVVAAALTSSCMSGLAPAASRSLTTPEWPCKLAVQSGD